MMRGRKNSTRCLPDEAERAFRQSANRPHPDSRPGADGWSADKEIAVIGMACRFPGASDDAQFWQNLVHGVDSVQEIPSSRWEQAKYYSPDGSEGRSRSKWCGLIEDIDQFDARFFNISPREAGEMDPQQRLLMEETLHCIEDAGIAPEELQTLRTGVFIGECNSDYQQISSSDETRKDGYAALGNLKAILSNRISYFFNLTGPSITIDSACASSLVVVHEAVKSLETGECDYAIVGAVSANVHPWKYVALSQSHMLSSGGQCRAFDVAANGYVPADGIGVVLLQRRADSKLRRNRVLGTIKASAVNHNGKTPSITAPSIEGQRELICSAYRKAGISPRTVTYVEAHGTGTSLGDPIEVEALRQAFGAYTKDTGFCYIGSVKSNIGHAEGAAGLAGLIKVLLMMRNRWIPQTLHVQTLNPIIDFANSPFTPAVAPCEWRQISPEIPRRASVSSFGFGGSNGHILIEEPPSGDQALATGAPQPAASPRLFAISARSAKSLAGLVDCWKAFVETGEFQRTPLRDLGGTLLNSRTRFEYRLGFAIQSHDDIKKGLQEFSEGSKAALERWNLQIGEYDVTGYDEVLPILDEFPVLRSELEAILDAVDCQLRPPSGSIRDGFRESRWHGRRRTANELLFGYAYVSTLMKAGFRPAMVSSTGRGVNLAVVVSGMTPLAAMLSGLLSPDSAARSLEWPKIPLYDSLHGREIHGCELSPEYWKTLCESATVVRDEVDAHVRRAKLLAGHQGTFRRYLEEWVAAAAGAGLDIGKLLHEGDAAQQGLCSDAERKCFVVAACNSLHRLNTKWQLKCQVEVDDPALRELAALVNNEVLGKERCARLLVDPVAGCQLPVEEMRQAIEHISLGAEYPILFEKHRGVSPIADPAEWLRQCQSNQLAAAPEERTGVLRIGSFWNELLAGTCIHVRVPAPATHLQDEVLLKLWLWGVPVKWDTLVDPASYDKVALPHYVFDRQRYWVETREDGAPAAVDFRPQLQRNAFGSQPQFTATFSGSEFFLKDHCVEGRPVLPGVAYLEVVRKAWAGLTDALGSSASAVHFTSVAWLRPIQVADAPVAVHVRLTLDETSSYAFEVYSQASTGESVLHAQGDIRGLPVDSIPRVDAPRFEPGHSWVKLDSAEFYSEFRAIGIDYGPAHRGVTEVRVARGEAVAKLALPSCVSATAADFLLHPSVADAALQAGVRLQMAGESEHVMEGHSRGPILPFSVESIELFTGTQPRMWARARFSEGVGEGCELRPIDVDLYDESGAVCMRLKRLSTRRAATGRMENGSLMTIQPVWTRFQPALEDAQQRDTRSRAMVFGAKPDWTAVIKSIWPDSVFYEPSADWTEASFSERLGRSGRIDRIIWFNTGQPAASVSDECVIEKQREGVFGLFHLIKAALHEGYGESELAWTICTVQALRIEAGERSDPTHASIPGLAGSMGKEFPHWRVRIIDLASGDDLPHDVFRISATDSAGPMAFRRGHWFRREFVSLAEIEGGDSRLRRGGVYILIGGAGGICSIWSRWLIERYQAQVIWIGRRQKNEAIQRQMDELCALGPAPEYFCADATRREALLGVYEEVQKRFGRVHGVVHAAIVLSDGALTKMTEAQFAAALKANVDVSVRIAQTFSSKQLDFILFFSSVQSFCTFAGQSNYAASCTFKDAFADGVRREWPCAVKVVNWGYWGSTGVVANEFYRKSMAQKGFGSLEPAEAFSALERLMASPVDQGAIVRTLRPGVIEGFDGGTVSPGPSEFPQEPRPSQLWLPAVRTRLEEFARQVKQPHREAHIDSLLLDLLWATLRSLGLFHGSTNASEISAAFRLSRAHGKWMEATIRRLELAGFVKPEGAFLIPSRGDEEPGALWKQWEEAKVSPAIDASLKPQLALAEACLRNLGAILTREKPAPAVLFPNGATQLVEAVFRNNPVADYCNEMAAAAVAAFLKERVTRDSSAQIRLLEIGGGTGATTAAILPRLTAYERNVKTYCFSDISKAFLLQAERDFGPRARFLTAALFDVEKPIAGQPAGGEAYDVVLATNVLHATRDIGNTLRNVKGALKANGLLVLNELSRNTLFAHLTFGLLDGWWLYEDDARRIPGSPILRPETWASVLRAEGFEQALFPVSGAAELGQQVIVAESVGASERGQRAAADTNESFAAAPPGEAVRNTRPADRFRDKCLELLRKQVAACLKMQPQQIDATQPFEEYGVDSILVIQLTTALRKTFADLSSTLFFEVRNLDGLVDRLIQTHGSVLAQQVGESGDKTDSGVNIPQPNHLGQEPTRSHRPGDVAIVGLSGRYPGASDPDEFWQRLRAGECTVSEVPAERWDWRQYYDERRGTPGRSCTRWGGFLQDVDKFDPLFFRIAPREAEKMDPQERLFLETAHAAIEDAGYTPRSLAANGKAGVFVGVMNSTYAPLPRYWSIANRVSHSFDFRGPSLAVDTACSSSLTAIHLAMESLYSGTSECAIAGGVNLVLHPRHVVGLNELTMLSSGRECRAFGDQADGFVDAEGVGAVVLKPAWKAIADGDHIYGIIKASSINAAGKSSGFTRPNPNTQRDLIVDALTRANVDPDAITYIEAHGTGTALGDPIEISALTQAFENARQARSPGERAPRRPIGSVKSNIGHAESAAGIAGLTKVLLQMKHGELAPSLHADVPNPHISFEQTPFVVQRRLEPWKRLTRDVGGRSVTMPRIAGISSFGAGGSNAHLIVEEYRAAADLPANKEAKPSLIVLSAMDKQRLNSVVRRLLDFLVRESAAGAAPDLASVAYTLQAGREPMKERAGLIVTSIAELTEKLGRYLENPEDAGEIQRGSVLVDGETSSLFEDEGAMAEIAGKWMRDGRYVKLLGLWTKGFDLDWAGMYQDAHPHRVSLPTYPFARERYWLGPDTGAEALARIHPLLHEDVSTANERRFRSVFKGGEAFIKDHTINGRKVLSAAACLELLRAALTSCGFQPTTEETVLRIGPVTWTKPIVLGTARDAVCVRLFDATAEHIAFQLYTQPAEALYSDAAVVHAEGVASIQRVRESAAPGLLHLPSACRPGSLGTNGLYERWQSLGVEYGASYRGIEELRVGDGEVLARISLPGVEGLVLNPGTLDSAFQASNVLLENESKEAGKSRRPYLPFAIEAVELFKPCPARVLAWVRRRTNDGALHDNPTFDVDLCTEAGEVCVRIRGMACRKAGYQTPRAPCSVTRIRRCVWNEPAVPKNAGSWDSERHVVVCERAWSSTEFPERGDDSQWHVIESNADRAGSRFLNHALQLFAITRAILAAQPRKPVLLQLVVPPSDQQNLLVGLKGFLQTASLENPLLHGQLIEIGLTESAKSVAAKLQECSRRPHESHVRYAGQKRQVHGFEETDAGQAIGNIPWKTAGVYLITGGAGGLGLIFAREIAVQTGNTKLILVGRSSLNAKQQRSVKELEQLGATVEYHQADVSKKEDVHRLIAAVLEKHGALTGILHAAGVTRDNFILKKTEEEFREVFAAKVDGTLNLDDATQSLKLDFFVLFSSVAALGNVGQADYSTANAFLDEFAGCRNSNVAAGLRCGRTLSINWPLWREGGMTVDDTSQRLAEEESGRLPIETASGLVAFYRALATDSSQVVVEEIQAAGKEASKQWTLAEHEDRPPIESPMTGMPAADLKGKALHYFIALLSDALKLPASRIQANAPLDEYGLDSILVNQLNRRLERDFGPLSKTLFFEYQTIAKIVDFFVQTHAERLRQVLHFEPARPAVENTPDIKAPASRPLLLEPARPSGNDGKRSPEALDIAIIGLSGRYPQSRDVTAYWNNLKAGVDCITEVPNDRWDWREYYSEVPQRRGAHSTKWGGFIEDVDKFDALFFNISPREAELMDPQERLFLEHVWMALEDAGYCRDSLSGAADSPASQIGVYAGVMYGEYQLFGAEATLNGQPMGFAGTLASIANRVSYVFDFHGPSITVDSMCSSSLTSLHLACQDLKSGRTNLAVAGGVNVIIHPNKYFLLTGMRFLSDRGRCESFGEGGDGYVPGEGVGAVVLKRLADAERDGDHIYGVVKGTALNHGGRSAGYTVPGPAGQQAAITRALQEAGVDPRTLSYIEAHGTGTKLGDPIEIAGLTKAFASGASKGASGHHSDPQCWIGSAKSNIGHCESAAGIAGVTKVLLQMAHRQIVPSLHSRVLNSAIDFRSTPFAVNQELRTWNRPLIDAAECPRRAGISSFGAGGANAHVVIEEYELPKRSTNANDSPCEFMIVVSARNEERLREVARRLHAHLTRQSNPSDIRIADLALTLQAGREAMEERLGFIVGSVDELLSRLEAFLNGREEVECFRGRVERNRETLAEFSSDEDMAAMVANWIAKRKYRPLLSLWTKGLAIDWLKLYDGVQARRISLPTYPFERRRHWIDVQRRAGRLETNASKLHPLLHENTSDLSEVRFTSVFTGEETFFKEQPGNGHRAMAQTACLEMACAAIQRAVGSADGRSAPIQFRDIAWAEPITVNGQSHRVHINVSAEDNGEVEYQIYSLPSSGGDMILHVRGAARFVSPGGDGVYLDMEKWRRRGRPMPHLAESVAGEDFVLARMPASDDFFALPSNLLEKAIEMAAPLFGGVVNPTGPAHELQQMDIFAQCPAEPWGLIERRPNGDLNVDVCDDHGLVHIRVRGLTVRSNETSTGIKPDSNADEVALGQWDTLTYLPSWEEMNAGGSRRGGPHRNVVVICSESRPRFVDTILQRYQANATRLLTIRLCGETRQLSDMEWHCALDDVNGFETCLRDVPVDCVYFAAALTEEETSIDERNVAACFKKNEIQLLRLAKVIGGRTLPTEFVDWYLLSHGGGVTGLAYSMAQGDHRFRIRNLELSGEDLRNPNQHERLLAAIINEGSSDRGELIRLESGCRYELNFVKFDWGEPETTSGLTRNGVYVILGGSGTVGRVITRRLIQEYQAEVIWIGRSPESSPEVRRKLEEFVGLRSSPSYVQADVRDFESIASAIGKIKQRHRRITGAIFCGAVFAFRNTVRDTSEAEFREIAEVKAKGSVNFFAALQAEPLDFLCYFSSVQSFPFIQARESCGYAAGNTFSDKFVHSLLADVRFPVGIMNWGYWHSTAAESALAERMGHRFGFITDSEGFHLFERFTGLLRRRMLHQVVCLNASPVIRKLMRCGEERAVRFGAEADSMIQAVLESE